MYQPIAAFPDPDFYFDTELLSLIKIWETQRSALEESGSFKEFIRRMQREWAIETGIIERLYVWDRGVTEVLIEQGIEASIISHGAGVSREEANEIRLVIGDHL